MTPEEKRAIARRELINQLSDMSIEEIAEAMLDLMDEENLDDLIAEALEE